MAHMPRQLFPGHTRFAIRFRAFPPGRTRPTRRVGRRGRRYPQARRKNTAVIAAPKRMTVQRSTGGGTRRARTAPK